MLDFESIKDMSRDMISEQQERNRVFEAMDAMFHGDWTPPGDLSNLDWFIPRADSRPHDAVKIASQVLSTLEPKITYQPLNPNPANKARANEKEQMLKWWTMSGMKRTKASQLSDLVMSAIMYDTIAIQVVHLGYQAKVLQTHKVGSARMRNWRRYGPFAFRMLHPSCAYPIETEFGLDGMLSVTVQPLSKVKAFWGERAAAIVAEVEKDSKDPFQQITVFDYMDPETRAVWAVRGAVSGEQGTKTANQKDTFQILEPTEHGLQFFPWIYRSQATNMASAQERRILPLLYSAHQFDHYNTSSLLRSLVISDAIATFAQPRRVVTGATPELAVEDDYEGVPGGETLVKSGHSVDYPPQRPLDRALQELAAEFGAEMDRSTGTDILKGGSIPAGTAFSTINLATQTGVQRLKPAKQLAELGLAEMCEHELLWIREFGETEVVYSSEKQSYGKQLSISPDEIDPDALYLSAELHPDVPTDRLARINGAMLMVQNLGYSMERALEETGVADPDQAIKEGMYEQMLRAQVQQKSQAMLQEQQFDVQMRLQAKQMMAQQAMQGGGGLQGGGQPPMQGTPPVPRQTPGGQGFNPAMGGIPPAQANPGLTRERASGRDRAGNEVP